MISKGGSGKKEQMMSRDNGKCMSISKQILCA
jgi:hypothetical protein